ncbi:MAG: DUF6036 family nucleotidyltransferase [Gemmatimonadota bacterium]
MNRSQLEHAIRAACDVAEETELVVFGSQAILGQYPEAPPELRASIEVDVQPLNHPERVDQIDGALGELSQFHTTHGFYVHGVSLEAATLPEGWEDRTVIVRHPVGTRGKTGHCLEAHDLAASKLFAYRPKDRDFVRTLLVEGLISPGILRERILELPVDTETKERLLTWLRITTDDLALT